MTESADTTLVGVDIGGTRTRLAILDALGRVLADRETPTPREDEGEALARWIDEAYHQCRAETSHASPPQRMGVGVPGILAPNREVVVRAVNLDFLEGFPLRDALVERTGLETVIDCDAVASAWGEYCARERIPKRFAYLTIGTGVGGAVILEGAIVRHTHHNAGHLGHLICDASDDAPVCPCGARGCLEACVGGPAIARAAKRAGFDEIGEVEPAVQNEDETAMGLVEGLAGHLAVGLINLAHVYPVDLLVVGGGIACCLPSLVRRAARRAGTCDSVLIPERMTVELTALKGYAGVVGAALLANETPAR